MSDDGSKALPPRTLAVLLRLTQESGKKLTLERFKELLAAIDQNFLDQFQSSLKSAVKTANKYQLSDVPDMLVRLCRVQDAVILEHKGWVSFLNQDVAAAGSAVPASGVCLQLTLGLPPFPFACPLCRHRCPHCGREGLVMYKRYEKKTAWLLDQTKTCHKAQLVRHSAVSPDPVSRPHPLTKPHHGAGGTCLYSHSHTITPAAEPEEVQRVWRAGRPWLLHLQVCGPADTQACCD